jgi:hypothetical protein
MSKTGLLSLMLTTLAALAAIAQDAPPGPRGGGHGMRRGGPRGPGKQGAWQGPAHQRIRQLAERVLEDLKQKDPERYAELNRQKRENPEAFWQALRELIPAYLRRQREQAGNRPPLPGGSMLERMQDENPKRFERLRQLRHHDRNGFERELRGVFRERGMPVDPRVRELEERSRQLAEQYHGAADADGKLAAKAKLRETLAEAFEARLASQEERVKRLAEELERMKQALAERRELREQIIDRRLEYLLEDPNLHW